MAVVQNSKLTRDLSISLLLYSVPVVAIYFYFKLSNGVIADSQLTLPPFLEFAKPVFANIRTWGLTVFMIVLGIIEFGAGLYDDQWTGEERKIDIISFLAPKLILPPIIAIFSLKLLPVLIPNLENFSFLGTILGRLFFNCSCR